MSLFLTHGHQTFIFRSEITIFEMIETYSSTQLRDAGPRGRRCANRTEGPIKLRHTSI